MDPANILIVLLLLALAFGLYRFLYGSTSDHTVVPDSDWTAAGVYPVRTADTRDIAYQKMEEMMQNSLGWIDSSSTGLAGTRGQFGSDHYAFLFYPGVSYGKYTLGVGYRTTLHGMHPTDPGEVTFPFLTFGSASTLTGALNVFWRGAENLTMAAPRQCLSILDGKAPLSTACSLNSSPVGLNLAPQGYSLGDCSFSTVQPSLGPFTWSASQAASLRRVALEDAGGQLNLDYMANGGLDSSYKCPDAYASGGFIADCVLGSVSFAGQQQYYLQNCALTEGASGSVPSNWNFLFAACTGAGGKAYGTASSCSTTTPLLVGTTTTLPRGRGKPFLALAPAGAVAESQASTAYSVYYSETDATPLVAGVRPTGQPHSFVLVSSAAELKTALPKGGVIVLASASDLSVNEALTMTKAGTVLLGLGLPTLRFTSADASLTIAAPGCILAGVILDAGAEGLGDLVTCSSGEASREVDAWTALFDVYARIGGPGASTVSAKTAMRISAGSKVVLENIWLWRADHPPPNGEWSASGYTNDCPTGLLVESGAEVLAYGLACEHFTQYCCEWNGNNGKLFFYQCELPYQVAPDWGNPGLLVTGSNFEGKNLGVYCNFTKAPTDPVPVGIKITSQCPPSTVTNAITVFLNNQGGIDAVLDCAGHKEPQPVSASNKYACRCSCETTCGGRPAALPAVRPQAPLAGAACASHFNCAKLGLAGNCCPNSDGKTLGCCT